MDTPGQSYWTGWTSETRVKLGEWRWRSSVSRKISSSVSEDRWDERTETRKQKLIIASTQELHTVRSVRLEHAAKILQTKSCSKSVYLQRLSKSNVSLWSHKYPLVLLTFSSVASYVTLALSHHTEENPNTKSRPLIVFFSSLSWFQNSSSFLLVVSCTRISVTLTTHSTQFCILYFFLMCKTKKGNRGQEKASAE